ncbi:MAG: hypothetical protein EA380_02945 [Phycisphaeraceae bacterium]|nr:MAG: hypothetical protein EA380_02945 [Phycisphaeraceae bacterium]
MKILLSFQTKAGTFYIGQSNDGRFHPIYDDESLGSYAQIWQATEDLAMNATFSVCHSQTGTLLDTSTLGIPEDPSEWERVGSQR